MSAFVEECRREWKRLGVPESIAEEMATDLETDLEEAQADGVSPAEIVGESNPRRPEDSEKPLRRGCGGSDPGPSTMIPFRRRKRITLTLRLRG